MNYDNILNRDRLRRPEILFLDFIRKGAKGAFLERGEGLRIIYRAEVVAVDSEGGKIENPEGKGSISIVNSAGKSVKIDARVGPSNPKDSIKARILTDGHDKFANDENLKVFWPFLPESVTVPIAVGDKVMVLFEDEAQTHGLWIAKVPGTVNASDEDNSDSEQNSSAAAALNVPPAKKPEVSNIDTTPKSNNLPSRFGFKK